ncbi:unnamed protein product [marine sediment metagenome]|uniref:DUF2007 domain-containing protein n=1 Tax=marine sediment metagenome TaxID=412755 RepID=X1HXF1_9ZZZZ
MSQDGEELGLPEHEYKEFVAVVFSRNAEEAERYCELLEDHDIPALVGNEDAGAKAEVGNEPRCGQITRGVPVLVPDALLDEASEVIADRESLEEFEIDHDVDEEDEEEEDEFGFGKEGLGLEIEGASDKEDLLDDEDEDALEGEDEDEDDDEDDEDDEDDDEDDKDEYDGP